MAGWLKRGGENACNRCNVGFIDRVTRGIWQGFGIIQIRSYMTKCWKVIETEPLTVSIYCSKQIQQVKEGLIHLSAEWGQWSAASYLHFYLQPPQWSRSFSFLNLILTTHALSVVFFTKFLLNLNEINLFSFAHSNEINLPCWKERRLI